MKKSFAKTWFLVITTGLLVTVTISAALCGNITVAGAFGGLSWLASQATNASIEADARRESEVA